MAFSAAMVWEVRTTGNDANGGGFLAGATGTDYSQQNSAQTSYTDLLIDATTNNKMTSVLTPFDATSVGNIVNVTAGTGFTVQRVQIISVASGVATCDKSLGTLGSTLGTGNLGGALATLAKVAVLYVASNKIFVKDTGTYVQTATPNFAVNTTTSNTAPISRLIGYTTTRGDGGRASIQLSTNTGLSAIKLGSNSNSVENFDIDCNNLGTSIGVEVTSAATCRVRNIKVRNFTSAGIGPATGSCIVEDCEVTAGTSAATAGINVTNGSSLLFRNYIHDNACPGIASGSTLGTILRNVVSNNTGASSYGIKFGGTCIVVNNTCYGNGSHGLISTSTAGGRCILQSNILVNNGGYGMQLDSAAAGWTADPNYDGNAYYNNALGTRNFADDTTVNPQNNVGPYTNVLDVTLTGDPFTNAAGNDFTLNNTAGAGAACRASGIPGAMPGLSQLGKLDMGVFQHADPAGGGLMINPGLSGGLR